VSGLPDFSRYNLPKPGLPDFSWYKHQNGKKYQKPINYTKRPYVIPNGHKLFIPNGRKICQQYPLNGPSKYTQIGIFGLERNHLATLTKTGENIPNDLKLYHRAIKFIQGRIPNGHIIYQHFPFQGPRKYTQIQIFG
jgi:hypothetical protein